MRIRDTKSSWRLILSYVAQVSLLSSALLYISVTGLDDGTECSQQLPDDTKLGEFVETAGECAAIQRDLNYTDQRIKLR